MATESTAIHNLLHGISRKAIPDDPDDDVLFAGSRRRDPAAAPAPRQAGGRAGMFTLPPPPPAPPMAAGSPFAAPPPRAPAGTPPFAAPPARTAAGTQPPPVGAQIISSAPGVPTMQLGAAPQMIVPLPHAFVRQPAHAIEEAHATVRVIKPAAWGTAVASRKKLYALPVALFVVVVALLGVYVSSGGDKRAAAQLTASDDKPAVATIEPKTEPQAEPEATPATVAAAAVVTPIEPAPSLVVESASVAPPATALSKDMIAPPIVVPESTFTAKREQTVPTVTATPIDAPTTAAGAAVPEAAQAPEAEAPVKAKKKSKRELAREKRAAKRAAKRAKTREPRESRVAVAEKPAKAEKAGKEDLNGNGAVAITSGTPREVWVDGRNSKRMTPLRVLLKPGKHKVTLFDKEHGSAKTFEIEVKPNTTTKVSK